MSDQGESDPHKEDVLAGQGEALPPAETGPGPDPAPDLRPAAQADEKPAAILFDVFGTVVDWRAGITLALADALAAKGLGTDADALADAWRGAYQPGMEPVRSGARSYLPLDDLHRETLHATLTAFDIAHAFSDAELSALARAWEALPPWPDAHLGLRRLKALAPCAPCSNGSISLMVHLSRFADLPWDAILGADLARTYKPAPAVYLESCAALRLAPEQVLMVACHPDDLEAAAAQGLRTAYIPRPMEWGQAKVADCLSVEDAAPRFDYAEADLEALAARFGG